MHSHSACQHSTNQTESRAHGLTALTICLFIASLIIIAIFSSDMVTQHCIVSEVSSLDTSQPPISDISRSHSWQHRHSPCVGRGSQHPQEHHQFPELCIFAAASSPTSASCPLTLSSVLLCVGALRPCTPAQTNRGSIEFKWLIIIVHIIKIRLNKLLLAVSLIKLQTPHSNFHSHSFPASSSCNNSQTCEISERDLSWVLSALVLR